MMGCFVAASPHSDDIVLCVRQFAYGIPHARTACQELRYRTMVGASSDDTVMIRWQGDVANHGRKGAGGHHG